jgi:hypothetical protein
LNLFQKTALVQDFPLFFLPKKETKFVRKKIHSLSMALPFHGKLEQWLSALDGNFEQNHEK